MTLSPGYWVRRWLGKGEPSSTGAKNARVRAGATAEATRSLRYAASPMLASKTPQWRSRFLVLCIGAGFVALGAKAFHMQALHADFYLQKGANRYERKLDLPANRGRIMDRNGLLLASSVPAASIWADPREVKATPQEIKRLAQLLGVPVTDLKTRIGSDKSFVWLRRQVDENTADQIKALGIKGVNQTTEYVRRYPEGEAAAHVVGFTNIEDRGQEGIELGFQKRLAGRDGERSVIKDRLGRVVEETAAPVNAENGQDIALSIDSKVQAYAFQRIRDAVNQHRAKAGSVVVLDAQSGEVLALANYPSYSPNAGGKRTGEQLRNRALTDTFEPGSTMKPLIAALALDTKRVTPDTLIDTSPGTITISGRTISDSHVHGALTVSQVIQKSSNVGTVKMAMRMAPKEMWDIFTAVGLGQRPNLEFPGAVTGRLRPYKSWKPIEQATMSYGYGLSASLFQLAHAYLVFARDGDIIPASITKVNTPPEGVRVFSTETTKSVRHMLQLVTQEGGTAPKAQALGYTVGGKTGTAHKQEGKGYATNKYRAWFVGIAPISKPRIVVAVMVDEPTGGSYYGGDVAAPVFSTVVQQTLRMMSVPPDMEVTPQIMARTQAQGEQESF